MPTSWVKSTGLEKTGTLPSQAAHAQPPSLSVPVANAQAGSHPRGAQKDTAMPRALQYRPVRPLSSFLLVLYSQDLQT